MVESTNRRFAVGMLHSPCSCLLCTIVWGCWLDERFKISQDTRVFCPLWESPPRLHYAPKPVEFREVGGPLWRKFPAQPHIDEKCGKKVAVKSLWPIVTFQTLRCFSLRFLESCKTSRKFGSLLQMLSENINLFDLCSSFLILFEWNPNLYMLLIGLTVHTLYIIL